MSFVLSVGIHIAILLLLATARASTFVEPTVFSVVIEPPSVLQSPARKLQEQIVSNPDTKETAEVAPETRFQAEHDVQVEREQIKRGDPDAGEVVAPRNIPAPPSAPSAPQKSGKEAKPQSAQKQQERTERTPDTLALRLDAKTLLKEFNTSSSKPTSLEEMEQGAHSAAGYTPFSRPLGSGAAFLGSRGNRDHIPTLPDGDITLLNTKANQFAVFVRRVATNVFGQLRSAGWEVIRASDIRQMQDFATVRAELSLEGELLSVRIDGHSGSPPFDVVLRDAVQRGARDPNPPKAAATDGKIKFVFQARSWSRWGTNPRSGAPVERRWLLLATGLE